MNHCCEQDWNTAFCGVCGKNLIGNQYIGMGERNLAPMLEEANRDLRWADSALKEAQRRVEQFKQEVLVPAQESRTREATKARHIRVALDYARQHKIE